MMQMLPLTIINREFDINNLLTANLFIFRTMIILDLFLQLLMDLNQDKEKLSLLVLKEI
jgi:hypothetical protein